MTQSTLLDGDERSVVPREYESDGNEEHGEDCDGEADDVERIHADSVEGRKGEAEDDGQNGDGNISQQSTPEEGDLPVLASRDDEVEIQR